MRTLYTIGFCVLISGCLPKNFDVNGFCNQKQDYRVKFNKAKTNNGFIHADWMVDNYEYNKEKPGRSIRKKGDAYRGRVYFDWNEDGTFAASTMYFSDLELLNSRNNGRIWITTRGLTPKYRQTELEVFLGNYVEALSGAYFSSSALDVYGYSVSRSRKFATKITEKQSIKLGLYKAVAATISIANLDQLQIDKEHCSKKIRVIIARIGGTTKQENNEGFLYDIPGKVLMVVGYSNTPDYFEDNVQDFEQFVESISFTE